MGKAAGGLHPPGSAHLLSLIKIETFLGDALDSPQRPSALTFSLCVGQGTCCKRASRSRVVPACRTRYLQISVFALHDFSPWPSVATAALSVASASGRNPCKVMHPGGHLERTGISNVVWLFASPYCGWRTEKTTSCAFFVK